MTDPIGTAQELTVEIADILARFPVRAETGSELDAMRRREAARAISDALQSRIAEVGRLTAALEDIAGAIHQGSASDVMTWHNLADACQQKARAALSLHRRPT